MPQLESDIAAVEVITRDVLRRVLELAAPDEQIERVAVARLFRERITTTEELNDFIKELHERLRRFSRKAAPSFLSNQQCTRTILPSRISRLPNIFSNCTTSSGISREEALSEELRLAVCKTLDVPERTGLRHARNDQVLLVAKAVAPIPQSLLLQDGIGFCFAKRLWWPVRLWSLFSGMLSAKTLW